MYRQTPKVSKELHFGYATYYTTGTPVTYRLAANTMSRLMAFEACSIFSKRVESPIMRAAFLNSLHVSSSLTIARTMEPSGTFVSSQISAKGVPCAHPPDATKQFEMMPQQKLS
jgi:hypothetical protein